MKGRLLVIFVGALIGCVAGYFLGVIIACNWLYPTSNLCGIYGVFITGPFGLVAGAVCGWVMTRPQETR